jgi:hypothetical protein
MMMMMMNNTYAMAMCYSNIGPPSQPGCGRRELWYNTVHYRDSDSVQRTVDTSTPEVEGAQQPTTNRQLNCRHSICIPASFCVVLLQNIMHREQQQRASEQRNDGSVIR